MSRLSASPALVVLLKCGGAGEPDAAPPPDAVVDAAPPIDAAPEPGDYRAEILRTEPYTTGGRTFTITLARVTRPDGGRTYVQWIPSDLPAPRPAIVVTLPYAGIDWTGEELDQRWATYQPEASGQYLDIDGPGYDGATTILYEPTTVAATAGSAVSHLSNGFSTLFVFGRYYAGGSVKDDIEDMRAGVWFLAQQPGVDHRRVGAIGGSWGGFEALYATTSDDLRFAAVVALFPGVDFPTWMDHILSRQGAAAAFMVPYIRRIYASTGGAPAEGGDYRGLRARELCRHLPREVLLVHDELDNLAPFAQSETLRATCGADAVYWRRDAEPDPTLPTHGPLADEPAPPSMYLYALSYLHLRLATPGQSVVLGYNPLALAAHLTTVRDAQIRGEDVSFAVPRLLELCDPRVRLLAGATAVSGAAAVAAGVNATWGTTYTAETIAAALALGLPPP